MIIPVAATDVTTGSTSTWTDVDVSAYVDAGNTAAVVILIRNEGAANVEWNYGIRKNGSTDAHTRIIEDEGWTQVVVGIDSNDIFEIYRTGTDVKFYITGYIPNSYGSFFTNSVDKSLGSTGAWTDIDISSDTGSDTAIVAFFLVDEGTTGASDCDWGFRKNGSTDTLVPYAATSFNGMRGAMIGVDSNEVCEGYIGATKQDFFLLGYGIKGAVTFTNEIDYSTTTTGSFVDVDLTDDIPEESLGALIRFFFVSASSNDARGEVRKNGTTIGGSSTGFYTSLQQYSWVAVDTSQVIEQYISSSSMDLYLLGYTLLPDEFSRADSASLPTDDTQLDTLYTTSEEADVAADDATRVGQNSVTSGNYVIHQYKRGYPTDLADGIKVTWNGQTDVAPSDSTVYLQIYNRNTPGWETLDSDNSSSAGSDFTLSGEQLTNLSHYYDTNGLVSVRVYQQVA